MKNQQTFVFSDSKIVSDPLELGERSSCWLSKPISDKWDLGNFEDRSDWLIWFTALTETTDVFHPIYDGAG